MKETTSLCFNSDGLINTKSIDFILNNDVHNVVLFSDGSEAAYRHIRDFDVSQFTHKPISFGLGKTPLYEMRVIRPDGIISEPNYIYSEDVRIKWICSRICPYFIKLNISDISSKSNTQAELPHEQTEVVCYLAYRLWTLLKVAEDRLCFPAVVIDRMTRWTYTLTPNTIDIPLLQKEVGLSSLNYNPMTDLLTVMVGEEEFSVKLSVLNAFYGSHILPMFNSIYGRRIRIMATVVGSHGQNSDPVNMTYGELGRVVEEMSVFAKTKKITWDNPIDAQDLLAFAKKVKINDESCHWLPGQVALKDFVVHVRDDLVRLNADNDTDDEDYSVEESDNRLAANS